ncbi:helix-turn-helix domain-containing protein [Antribacter sp. KLBMP9083]|uniref:Helix-turn-helix domain-containing protein n=1 Tax=Antribacter soli TaxID=2910976 RepID=A0AA41QFI5_9MICO|nr:helix-turn-helix domain-containing protein [Antribacter soli]MCF4121716.1 helix-turn-helix domain-containing protein [Antribacter soli]
MSFDDTGFSFLGWLATSEGAGECDGRRRVREPGLGHRRGRVVESVMVLASAKRGGKPTPLPATPVDPEDTRPRRDRLRENGAVVETRWKELGDFLKARRAELRPEQLGLDVADSQRRVPGLRRSEVARIAAISTEYYTRLEQGRLPASAPVLADLARVMRMNDDHRAYLFELAGKVLDAPKVAPRQTLQAPLQRMLDDLATTPAFVIGRRTEILGWNRLGAALITDFAAIPERERYFIRLLFTDPRMRRLYADWSEVVQLAIAQLRMVSARYPDDPQLAAIVRELSDRDADFTTFWTSHDVASRGTGSKRLLHPIVGELILDWEALSSASDPDQQIIIWTAAPGSRSHDRLRELAAYARERHDDTR